jgi:hypothetical protein
MAFSGASSDNWLSSSGNLSHGIGTGGFTLAGWWYPTAIGEGNERTGYWNGNRAGNFGLLLANASNLFTAYGSDGNYPFNTTLTANAWVHLAVRRSGNVVTGWVNGVQEATTWTGFALGNNSIPDAVQWICGTSDGLWTGKAHAAEVALWAAALTTAEIAALAKRYTPPAVRTSGLKAYWPLVREINDRWASNLTMSANSTAAFVTHVPVIGEFSSAAPSFSAAGGGGFKSAWARNTNTIIQPLVTA